MTSGRAQLPPTKPSIEPSGWISPRAPGRAEVGRRTATTVARANDSPVPLELDGPFEEGRAVTTP